MVRHHTPLHDHFAAGLQKLGRRDDVPTVQPSQHVPRAVPVVNGLERERGDRHHAGRLRHGRPKVLQRTQRVVLLHRIGKPHLPLGLFVQRHHGLVVLLLQRVHQALGRELTDQLPHTVVHDERGHERPVQAGAAVRLRRRLCVRGPRVGRRVAPPRGVPTTAAAAATAAATAATATPTAAPSTSTAPAPPAPAPPLVAPAPPTGVAGAVIPSGAAKRPHAPEHLCRRVDHLLRRLRHRRGPARHAQRGVFEPVHAEFFKLQTGQKSPVVPAGVVLSLSLPYIHVLI